MIHIYFDGSSKWRNDIGLIGKSRTCFIVIFENNTYYCQQDSWPACPSLEAEWKAFFLSVNYCVENNLNNIHFYGDCLGVIEGAWGIEPRKQKKFFEEFEQMLKPDTYLIDYVRRDLNLAGICLDDGSQSKHFQYKLLMLEGVEYSKKIY